MNFQTIKTAAAILFLACLLQPLASAAAQTNFPPFLYAAEGTKKILEYGPNAQVVWDYPAEMSRDVWRLPNGNVLFCYNQNYNPSRHDNPSGVIEVTPDKQIAWQYATTGQVWSCQRLANGHTLIGAASQGKLLIVSPAGFIAKEIKLLNKPGHSCLRNARQLPNGNFLVAEESAHAAREYTPDGNLLREIKVNFPPYSAVRLPNGNTLICGQKSMLEVDPADQTIWSLEGTDIPEMGIRWFAGIQVLPKGNIFHLQRRRQGPVPGNISGKENRLAKRPQRTTLAHRPRHPPSGSASSPLEMKPGYPIFLLSYLLQLHCETTRKLTYSHILNCPVGTS